MNVVGLVVEVQRRRGLGPKANVLLRHFDREIQGLVVPSGVRDGAQVVGARIRLLAAAVLVLELESERLGLVEAIERSVERWGSIGPQRGTDRGLGRVKLDQGRERRLRRARACQTHASSLR